MKLFTSLYLFLVKLIKHETDHKLNVSVITIKTEEAYEFKIYDTLHLN